MEGIQNDEIGVSIICNAYNHARYIRKTFEGFVAQKTNFNFEVLVHDDASTDGTTGIIREYVEKYPKIFKPVYQTENQYSKGIRVSYVYNFPRAGGKYLAHCEGDDYWCDENKLQKQFDAMEKHPECSISTHNVRIISEDEKEVLGIMPKYPFTGKVVTQEEFLRRELIEGYAVQTSCFFIRTEYIKQFVKEAPLYCKFMTVGDIAIILYLMTKGKVYYIEETMSCYRFGGDGSFRQRRKKNPFLEYHHLFSLIYGAEEYNKYTEYKYDQLMRAYMYIKYEQIEKIEKILKKGCESSYLCEVYQGKENSIRKTISYFLRTKMTFIYNLMLFIYKKFYKIP